MQGVEVPPLQKIPHLLRRTVTVEEATLPKICESVSADGQPSSSRMSTESPPEDYGAMTGGTAVHACWSVSGVNSPFQANLVGAEVSSAAETGPAEDGHGDHSR